VLTGKKTKTVRRYCADSNERIAPSIRYDTIACGLSLWLIGTVRAEPETVISRAWVQSPDPAE